MDTERKKYQLKKPDAIAVILAFFQEPNIRIEDGQVIWMALNEYRNQRPSKVKKRILPMH